MSTPPPLEPRDRIIPALDVSDAEAAAALAQALRGAVSHLKIGLELFTAEGPKVVQEIRDMGYQVFLDLKLHDIPNTVRGAARSAGRIGVRLLTVHASGGEEMIRAAVEGAIEGARESGLEPPRVLVVTVLTSLGTGDLKAIGWDGPVEQVALRLAALGRAAGAAGVVCSPHEARAMREALGPHAWIVTPGVRPRGAASDDQARVATPEEALTWGADQLVVGRPIRQAPDPAAAARMLVRACQAGADSD